MRNIWRSFNRNIGRILAYIAVGLIITLLSNYLGMGVVHAITQGVSARIDKVGTATITSYSFNKAGSNTNGQLDTTIAGLGFASSTSPSGPVTGGYTTRLTWNLPVSYLKNSDTASFTVGMRGGFVTQAQMAINSGWVSCQALSQTPMDSKFPGIYFTSYTCSYDSTLLPSSGDVTLRFFATGNLSNVGSDTSINASAIFYYNVDSYFYKSSSGDIKQSIIDQTDKLNEEQKKTNDKLDETNNNLKDLNNNITNSDTSDAKNDANSFFEDFKNNSYGLTDVITMPLKVINNITNGTCTPLSIPVPFVDQNITLPCMYSIYEEYFGGFLVIYQTITFGVISYWVCINIFRMVKNFKNPDNDEVEVFDL